jgi:hypothetical protein
MNIYWPGTNIVKSQGNAFTSWKEAPSLIMRDKEWKLSEAARRQVGTKFSRPFTVYSKARAAK